MAEAAAAHAPASAGLSQPADLALHLKDHGYATITGVLDDAACEEAIRCLNGRAALPNGTAGCRDMLASPWCRDLAEHLQAHPALAPLLPQDAVAVQCTLFEKSPARNWLVAWHQDLSIPVAGRVEHAALGGWAQKDGIWFVQPPSDVLASLLAVRVHLDPCDAADGPLRVVPASHQHGRLADTAARTVRDALGELTCPVPRGGALLMRPLLLHASSRASGTSTSRRRVLHFVWGPRGLPLGLRWPAEVV